MERKINLEEISDGRLYTANDMVRADCGDCKGCSACCRGMGESIVLDPLDFHRLLTGLSLTAARLLEEKAELHVVDGIILPNLKMAGQNDACVFLNEEGRCSIHALRPGFCRLFPLGRLYEERSFRYILQVHECRKENRTKVKVRRWLDTPDLGQYEAFTGSWHFFLKDVSAGIKEMGAAGEPLEKTLCLYILKEFYITPYDSEGDFYKQFYGRLHRAVQFMASQGVKIEENR